jgi:hypothetical protein
MADSNMMNNKLRFMMLQMQMTQHMTQNAIIADLKLKLTRKRRQKKKREVEKKRQKKRRCIWVREWLQRRPELGQYSKLLKEVKKEDTKAFFNFMRMDYTTYKEILHRIEGRLTKTGTNYRKSLSAGLKLAITLRYLAAGDSYHSLMYGFRVAHNTISILVREVCEAIIAEFSEEMVPCPNTTEEWKDISKKFSERWNFHHCLGALDGKHIAIKCPKNGGSLYYNYKGFHSVILMALVDAEYKFTWVEVGSNGSAGDAQVFNNGELREAIIDGSLNLPPPEPLPHDDKDMPYFLIADDAFALRKWMMKPFSLRHLTRPQRIFNYRLSRARRIVENAFGILAHRFRCLLTTLQQEPKTVTSIVLACVCLHNLLRGKKIREGPNEVDREDEHHNVIPGVWREDSPLTDGISNFANNTTTQGAKLQRDYLSAYYNSDVGSVPWQNDMI